jgi:phage baseplate assembly protein W
MAAPVIPGYGRTEDLGANWRIQFADADGIPLNMLSFEVIDFGAIAYKEIFQNVKTILATPLFSAALERLLGVDQVIVDLPIDQAAQATVAILDALYFWEPRVEVVNIDFESDVISGHLICNLQLKIKNVIYGTEQPYDRNNILKTHENMSQGPTGSPRPPRTPGTRGSIWFTGTEDPPEVMESQPPPIGAPRANDLYLNTTTGDIFVYVASTGSSDMFTWRKVGT